VQVGNGNKSLQTIVGAGPSAWSTEQVVTGPREVWLEMSLLGEGANPDDEGDAPFRSFVLDWRHVGALIGLAGQLDDRRGRRAELASRRYPAKAGDDAAVAVDQNGGLVKPNSRIEAAISVTCASSCVRALRGTG